MTSTLIALSPSLHGNMRFFKRNAYHHAQNLSAIPILLSELSRLIPHYVLGFIKFDDHFIACALTGQGNKNLYLDQNGIWLSGYVPSFVRGFPFELGENPNGESVFCIHKSNLTDDQDAQAIFDDKGDLSAPAREYADFLTKCETSRQQTQTAVDALIQYQLLEPWALTIEDAEGEPFSIKGLYRVNEQALGELKDHEFASLRTNGALALAYGTLFSMAQHGKITELLKYHQHNKALNAPVDMDLDDFFSGDDDLFKF